MFKNRFKARPITETITVGDCLKRKREELGISLKDLGKKVGIREEYLENLENGNYADLPPQVYVRGFIKSYAGYLGVDATQLIKIFNREVASISVDEAFSRKQDSVAKKRSWKEYLVVTPRMLTFVGSFVIVSVLGYYFMHQINSFNSKPYLFIDSPSVDEVVQEKELTVSGKTETDAILRINGQEISVNPEGNFSQKITLAPGRNVLVVEAKNRFSRSDKREINIVYEKPAEDRITVEEITPESKDTAIAKGMIVEEEKKEEGSGAVLGVNTAAAKDQEKTEETTTDAATPAAEEAQSPARTEAALEIPESDG